MWTEIWDSKMHLLLDLFSFRTKSFFRLSLLPVALHLSHFNDLAFVLAANLSHYQSTVPIFRLSPTEILEMPPTFTSEEMSICYCATGNLERFSDKTLNKVSFHPFFKQPFLFTQRNYLILSYSRI